MVLVFLVLAAFTFLILFIGRWLTRSSDGAANRVEQILSDESFVDRYRPMERLLRESDWQYLSTQPGFTSRRINKIRAQRRDLFRRYLDSLNGDFGAMCLLVRALMVQSDIDRPELSSALFRIRMTFFCTLLKVRLRLVAHAIGVPAIQIDATALTASLEQIGAFARGLQLTPELNLA
jgi:hypothetical protein